MSIVTALKWRWNEVVERGGAHRAAAVELFDAHRLGVVLPDPVGGGGELGEVAVGGGDLSQQAAVLPGQQPVVDPDNQLDLYELRHFGASYMPNELELEPWVIAEQLRRGDGGASSSSS